MGLYAKLEKRFYRRLLSRRHALTVDILNEHPEIAAGAMVTAFETLEAKNGGSNPNRATLEWPVMTQMGTGIRYGVTGTLPKLTPFNLRRFSEYPPSRRAINAICNPILDMPWEIARIRDPLGDPLPEEIPAEQKQRMMAMTNSLRKPNNDSTWRQWLEMILEDIVVGGYGASEIANSTNPDRPLYLWPVDGQSIRINLDWNEKPNGIRYAQSMGYTGVGVGSSDTVKLRDEQLMYFKFNPRTNTPFGLGYLEVAFLAVNAFLGAFDYATRRASNATPNYVIFLGESVDMGTARQWQQFWQQTVEGAGRAPIIGGGRTPQVAGLPGGGDDMLFLKWQEFLIRNIAMAFGIGAQKLGLERDVNRSTANQQDIADWDTVAPVANHVADYITGKLLHGNLGWNDLEFKWLIRDTDELRQADILLRQYDVNAIKVNEIRDMWDREPMDEEWGELTKDQYENKAKAEYEQSVVNPMGGPPISDGPKDQIRQDKVEAKMDSVHQYSTTHVRLGTELETEIRTFAYSLIDPDDVYEEEGFEETPHVTVKYGIQEDISEALPLIYSTIQETPQASGKIGDLAVFSSSDKDYDVVVLKVESAALVKLNAAISEVVPNVNTFRNYRPHITLAYVKGGTGKKFTGRENPLKGTSFKFTSIEFVDSNGVKTDIPMKKG